MTSNPKIKTINVQELKNKMDTQAHLCLIDVRELNEWQSARIERAIHIPKDDIAEKIHSHVPNKEQAIYLHCRSGVRSLYAAEKLIELGYQEVYSVNGGIMEWATLGYPIS